MRDISKLVVTLGIRVLLMSLLIGVSGLIVAAFPTTEIRRIIKMSDVFPVASARMLNGSEMNISNVPWQVSILYNKYPGRNIKNFAGSGSIIAREWVLTAAHVVCSVNRIPLVAINAVSIGSSDFFDGRKHRIGSIVCHGGYAYLPDSETTINDIALIKVEDPFDLTSSPFPKSIGLYDYRRNNNNNNNKRTDEASVSGWGSTRIDGIGISESLKYIRMDIYSTERCSTFFTDVVYRSSKRPVPPDQFCASGNPPDTHLCYGDSGNGLVLTNSLVGIASWILGDYCGNSSNPAVFTNVTYFKPWIETTIRGFAPSSHPRTISTIS